MEIFSRAVKSTRTIVVDLWKTGAHGAEIGFKKSTQHQAKSRQFTKDTDIIGDIKEGKEEKGYVTFRENPWKEEIPAKKLVIKSFTQSMNWKGTMEELIARGVAQSISAEKGMPSFIINISGEEYMIPLERVQRRASMNKAIYALIIIDEKTNEAHPFSIEENRLTLGSDWDVYDMRRKKIAKIDGSKFNIGGKYTIDIDEEAPTYHKRLADVLVLFSTSLRFLDDVEEKLKKTVEYLEKSDEEIKLTKEEAMLFMNPRRIAV